MGEQANKIGKKLEGFGEKLFAGFGWIPKDSPFDNCEQIKDCITLYSDNRDVQQIIKGFLKSGKALKIWIR